ncbi:hypothetical protein E2C01_081274 [Portunus trituberculatus]|uniref:Uncharacterized protein n=1 Tax=Portunus trituberculatus TaxID=210409 RepID=A0A5B7IVD3_PORTR|nr:hypothetical protein [Portunus trituberculatus]
MEKDEKMRNKGGIGEAKVTTGRMRWAWRRLWSVNSRRRLPKPCTTLTARSCSLKSGKPVSQCSALDIGVK